jgi:hypothetical protein
VLTAWKKSVDTILETIKSSLSFFTFYPLLHSRFPPGVKRNGASIKGAELVPKGTGRVEILKLEVTKVLFLMKDEREVTKHRQER